jgi:hypothetical protein
MNTDELLKQLDKRFDSIDKRFDTLEQGQKRLEQGQAHTNTALEAVAAGQKDLREKVGGLEAGHRAIREEMATKADIQDLKADVMKKTKSNERRIDDLEKEAGLPNPHKN